MNWLDGFIVNTHYINTDLDLVSTEDLTPLAAAFEACGERGMFALNVIPVNDEWRANFELNGGETEKDPETTICGMLDIIEVLDAANAAIWNRRTKREFNIGFRCGIEPHSIEHRLSNTLMRRIVDAGANVGFTLYQHTTDNDEPQVAEPNPPAAGSPSSG
jgi:hypothetical protein